MILDTKFVTTAKVSADGHWLAYASNESGRLEIYVRPSPAGSGKWQISTDGGMEPNWAPNGKELFYRNGDKMMEVEVSTSPTFHANAPKLLFEGRFLGPQFPVGAYGVSADAQRLLMLKPDDYKSSPAQINLVLNWFEELKKKVPTGK